LLNFIHYQSTSIKTELLQPATYKSTVSGGLTGGSLVNAQIAGVVGQNAVENNNLDILREEESKRELELATKYNWTSKQLTDYITNKSRGSIKGFAAGAVEAIEGAANAVRHPVDTAKGIYGVISDPSAVYNAIELSVKEWEELYTYALQTNPGLAGQMEGYLSGKVGGSLTGGYLITGGAAKVVSSLAKSKYATKITEIAKGARIGANAGKGKTTLTPPIKINVANDFTKSPQSIWGRSADDIAKDFQAAGYQVNVRQSTRGSGKAVIIEVKGHPEISQIQIHPGGGRHGGSYYKVSTTTQGTIKIVDPNTYKPSVGEKAIIINKPKR
jgi:hypothetical protein